MPEHRDYRTPHGVLHYDPIICRDDYPNIVVYDQGGGHTVLWLQRCAMKAFWAAEIRLAKRLGWSDKRIKDNGGHGRAIRVLPGTNRTCARQAQLYRLDPHRYASPNTTAHTRAFALDVDQAQPNLPIIRAALLAEGWKQVRADEPWHYSYFIAV